MRREVRESVLSVFVVSVVSVWGGGGGGGGSALEATAHECVVKTKLYMHTLRNKNISRESWVNLTMKTRNYIF